MSDTGFRTAHIDEIEPVVEPDAGEAEWRPVRHRLGVGAFGVNAWVAREDGGEAIEEHDERNEPGAQRHEELYYVARGNAVFTIGGEEIDAPEGTLVFVRDPALVRAAVGRSAGTTVLSFGAERGVAFEISPWESKHLPDGA
jgi:AraC-like ligand binding domain